MQFDMSSHPIYDSIMDAICLDPEKKNYSPMPADLAYLIGHVPETHRNNGIGINAALKTLEQEKFVRKIIEGNTAYYDATAKGREHSKKKHDIK